jgi:hypothetical protein
VPYKVEQCVKYLGCHRHQRAITSQQALPGINAERAEFIDLGGWMVHGVSYLLRNFQETPKTSVTASGDSIGALVRAALLKEIRKCAI